MCACACARVCVCACARARVRCCGVAVVVQLLLACCPVGPPRSQSAATYQNVRGRSGRTRCQHARQRLGAITAVGSHQATSGPRTRSRPVAASGACDTIGCAARRVFARIPAKADAVAPIHSLAVKNTPRLHMMYARAQLALGATALPQPASPELRTHATTTPCKVALVQRFVGIHRTDVSDQGIERTKVYHNTHRRMGVTLECPKRHRGNTKIQTHREYSRMNAMPEQTRECLARRDTATAWASATHSRTSQ